jgi:hypothetical protein
MLNFDNYIEGDRFKVDSYITDLKTVLLLRKSNMGNSYIKQLFMIRRLQELK